MIQLSKASILPFGPIMVTDSLPFKSPEFLTGGLIPNAYESVFDIST
jgi:hypothetical protein